MLTVGLEHLQEMAQNKNLKVYLYGQELSVKTVLEVNCPGGRFEAGLPSISAGSLLFLQHIIFKMDDQAGSRMGIELNGSPLFNGDATHTKEFTNLLQKNLGKKRYEISDEDAKDFF